MICYTDTNDPVLCPYCKSEDACEHLFILYDHTFETIEGGWFIDNDLIETLIFDFFKNVIESYGLNPNISFRNSSDLNYIWNDVVDNKDCYFINDIFEKEDFFLPNTNMYVFQILDEIEIPEIGEFEGGPGQSSTFYLYYVENCNVTLNELTKAVTTNLELNFSGIHEQLKQDQIIEDLLAYLWDVPSVDERRKIIHDDIIRQINRFQILASERPEEIFEILEGDEVHQGIKTKWASPYTYQDFIDDRDEDYDPAKESNWNLEKKSIEYAITNEEWKVTSLVILPVPGGGELPFMFEYFNEYTNTMISTPYDPVESRKNDGFIIDV